MGKPTQQPAARAEKLNAEQSRLLNLLRQLARRQRILLDRISRAEELADAIACDLACLEEQLAGLAGNAGNGNPFAAARRSSLRAMQVLRQSAEPGISALELKPQADGSAEVRVDAGKRFPLPPILADLLSILSIDTGRSKDDLIGWKTLDEVAILLAKKSGGRFSKHAVTQQVYRLRKELFSRGGVNPFLVQTNRRLGVRFALRRQPAPVIEEDGR